LFCFPGLGEKQKLKKHINKKNHDSSSKGRWKQNNEVGSGREKQIPKNEETETM